MPDSPQSPSRSLNITSAIVALLYGGVAAAMMLKLVPLERIGWAILVSVLLHGIQAALPAIWGRAPVPTNLAETVAAVAAKAGPAVVFLAVLLGSGVARAEQPMAQPESAVTPRGQVALPRLQLVVVPSQGVEEPAVDATLPALTQAQRAQIAIAAVNSGLVSVQQGLQQQPLLQPWLNTKGGQIFMGIVSGGVVVLTAAGSTAAVLAALR